MAPHRTSLLALAALASLAGCGELEPLPSVYDDPAMAAAIAADDGFDGVATLHNGFVHGAPISYWTVAAGGERAMPVYRLCRPEGGDDCAALDHPPVIDALPGDADYSPFAQVHWVELPEGWDGRLASLEAIEAERSRLGLPAPRPTSELWHCPVASLDAEIEVGPMATVLPETVVYVRDREARCFDFSASRPNRAVLPDGTMFVRNVYLLTREGDDDPLVEWMRDEDLNGDGDLRDSNNILGVDLEDGDYTPLWRMVLVTVPASVGSIDTSMDQTVADYTASTDMFDIAPDYTITPRTDRLVSYEITDQLVNCPLQSAPGAL